MKQDLGGLSLSLLRTTESLSSSGTRHGYRNAMTRFLLGLFVLVVRLFALITVKVCDAVGIHQMRRFAYGKERPRLASNAVQGARQNSDADPLLRLGPSR